jgi:hypothetical protein
MKTNYKDKKIFEPVTVAKGTTLAAMVAALGISLGTEVKNVYAQGMKSNKDQIFNWLVRWNIKIRRLAHPRLLK